MSKLGQTISQYWSSIQGSLFPFIEEELDPLTQKQQQLITIMEVVRTEQFIPDDRGYAGRPRKTRAAIARSFVAKIVYNTSKTRDLWERLHSDKNLRRVCGWENSRQIPSEATFSRAMKDFAETQLLQRVHEALINKIYRDTDTIVIHNARDSTAVEPREKPLRTCSKSVIRMLCCYKFAISGQKIFGILKNIAKIFCPLIANFSKQIIRSKILNRF